MEEKPKRPPQGDPMTTREQIRHQNFLDLIAEEGGVLSSEEAKRAYDGSKATADGWEKAVAAGQIIEINNGDTMCYPAWQFRPEGGTLSGLREVLEILSKISYYNGLTAAIFLLNVRAYIGKRPLDVLRQPTLESLARVLDLARDEGR